MYFQRTLGWPKCFELTSLTIIMEKWALMLVTQKIHQLNLISHKSLLTFDVHSSFVVGVGIILKTFNIIYFCLFIDWSLPFCDQREIILYLHISFADVLVTIFHVICYFLWWVQILVTYFFSAFNFIVICFYQMRYTSNRGSYLSCFLDLEKKH